MSTFRDHHTATLPRTAASWLPAGEAHAISTSADVYDPANGKFTKTGSMHTGRWLHTATLLNDGRVAFVREPRTEGPTGWQANRPARSLDEAAPHR